MRLALSMVPFILLLQRTATAMLSLTPPQYLLSTAAAMLSLTPPLYLLSLPPLHSYRHAFSHPTTIPPLTTSSPQLPPCFLSPHHYTSSPQLPPCFLSPHHYTSSPQLQPEDLFFCGDQSSPRPHVHHRGFPPHPGHAHSVVSMAADELLGGERGAKGSPGDRRGESVASAEPLK